jgi:hypothetical protein
MSYASGERRTEQGDKNAMREACVRAGHGENHQHIGEPLPVKALVRRTKRKTVADPKVAARRCRKAIVG